MKILTLILLIVSTSLFGQNHGTGGGSDTHGQNLIASVKCQNTKELAQELVNEFNQSSTEKINSYKEYVERVTKIAYKIKFNELKNASEQQIRVKCGDVYVNKILKENPWLENKRLHELFGKINNMDAGKGCMGFDQSEIEPYLDFLKIWTKQESPALTPVQRFEGKDSVDNPMNTSG